MLSKTTDNDIPSIANRNVLMHLRVDDQNNSTLLMEEPMLTSSSLYCYQKLSLSLL